MRNHSTRSQAFGLGVVASGAFKANDRLSFGLSSPLKTVSGTIHLNLPVTIDAAGTLVREARTVNLADGARELAFEGGYVMPLSQGSTMAYSLTLRDNAGGIARQKNGLLAIRYTLRF